ncbi:MAG: hypothetical protein AB1424_01250 [Thermodesulfobacteriota bacterium]
MDLSALKDSKTTLPGLAMILLTILILSGKLPVELLLQKLPVDYIIGAIFGGGGVALLGANSYKPLPPPVQQEIPASPVAPAPPATPAT